jgi:medium-chain acyl-[acyl-carrier-protein] hydrolase
MTTTSTYDLWIKHSKPNPQTRLRLFCFPYAGGWSQIFRPWADSIPESIQVCPIELPGRGPRLREAPFTQLFPLIKAIAQALLPHLDKPFAFFGHSMGGLISFELVRLLRRMYGLAPTHLFISGCRAPQLFDFDSPAHTLPEKEFIELLSRLGGTQKTLLENVELRQLILPTLRADFSVVETYTYDSEQALDCPITAFGGWQDFEVCFEELQAWREQTRVSFSMHMFPGNHFFLHSAQSLLLQEIHQKLSQEISKGY